MSLHAPPAFQAWSATLSKKQLPLHKLHKTLSRGKLWLVSNCHDNSIVILRGHVIRQHIHTLRTNQTTCLSQEALHTAPLGGDLAIVVYCRIHLQQWTPSVPHRRLSPTQSVTYYDIDDYVPTVTCTHNQSKSS